MATILPTWTRTLDNAFTQTWYDIRPDAQEQILNATVVWALLKMKGCFKPQRGGDLITRTLRYDYQERSVIDKNDTLPMGTKENRTMGRWTFRYVASHIQRDAFSDRENSGKYRISDYIKNRTEDAYDGLKQGYEMDVLRPETTDESGKHIQSLLDIVPSYANRATGTYGLVSRANDWWQPKYEQITGAPEIELLSKMNSFYNTVGAQVESPDILLTTQAWYELYTEFGLDAIQLVGNQKLMDLGFESVKFKGKDLVWSPNVPDSTMLFLCSKYIDVVYDPAMWFEMTEWKPIFNQTDRIAHILCCMNIVCNHLRRQGRLFA